MAYVISDECVAAEHVQKHVQLKLSTKVMENTKSMQMHVWNVEHAKQNAQQVLSLQNNLTGTDFAL